MMLSKQKVYLCIGAVMLLSVAGELGGIHMHHPSWWPLPFGYEIFFGFVSCALLIFTAKVVMAFLLQREESYYDGGEDNE